MTTQRDKAMAMKALHEGSETFLIPGPWDVGSARVFEAFGFKALATTSGGFAFSIGKVDGDVTLAEKVAHCRALADATEIPITADLENGYGDEPEVVAKTITAIADSGVVGGSIEDFDGEGIYDFDLAVERIAAAVEAAQSLTFPFALIARSENLLRGYKDLDETIRRLQAYEAAGADVLFAPALRTLDDVRTVVGEVSKPLSVIGVMVPGATLDELADAGARRISIGGALAQVAYGVLVEGAREMKEQGSFGWLAKMSPENNVAAVLESKG